MSSSGKQTLINASKALLPLSSKGIKGIERISWRNLMLFRLAQSSEELWSIGKNKKEDPHYNPSAFMLVSLQVSSHPESKGLH